MELVNDIVFLALTVGFFALAALLVRACDQIIGADESTDAVDPGIERAPSPDAAGVATTPEAAR